MPERARNPNLRFARPFAAAAVLLGFVQGSPAFACPVCFSAANERVLHTYYLTAVGMTLLPFLIVGAIGGWLYRRVKR